MLSCHSMSSFSPVLILFLIIVCFPFALWLVLFVKHVIDVERRS